MNKLILGSASPRRRDILTKLGFGFEVRPADVEEVLPDDYPADRAATYLSELKSGACLDWLDVDTVVLTADTTVILGEEVVNKPAGHAEAHEMLRRLCGRTHAVTTGVTTAYLDHDGSPVRRSYGVSTRVTLAAATDAEIRAYVDAWRPLDKAGGYGVQDWLGWAKCSSIEGSYSNVMGLPGAEVFGDLVRLGIPYDLARGREAA